MSAMDASLEAAAVRYANMGLRVLPWAVKNGDKVPLVKGWPDKATSDVEQVRKWWAKWPEANIGIATGPQPGFPPIWWTVS